MVWLLAASLCGEPRQDGPVTTKLCVLAI
jgi:hypothetical protein